jgi:sarcosine oxidase subunit alpha
MNEEIPITVNGRPLSVPAGSTVAAAVARSGVIFLRRSVTGQPRSPLCGAGVCFECRVTIDGEPCERSCLVLCKPGMSVTTDE